MNSTICLHPSKGTSLRGTELEKCYVGDVLHGVRHGVGTYHYPNKFFKYQGQYSNGKKHGLGKFWMADGSYYEGAFQDDEIEGQGCKYFSNGNVYKGGFHLGEMHGYGILVLANTDVYEGMFEANQFAGEGLYRHANGDEYVGTFYNHKREGYGVMTYHTGDRYAGHWKQGKRTGHGKAEYVNNDIYEGAWQDDEWHGQGEWKIWRWDIVYRGNFIRGVPEVTANKLNAFWMETADVTRKKVEQGRGVKGTEQPTVLELEAGQKCPRPITIAAQCAKPLPEEEPSVQPVAPAAPPDDSKHDKQHNKHDKHDKHDTKHDTKHDKQPQLQQQVPPQPPVQHPVYGEAPPEGQQWVTATMEYGRDVLVTLHASGPQPLPEDRPFSVNVCTVMDGKGEVSVKLQILKVSTPPCLPLFLGDDEPVTALHVQLQAGQHTIDPFILGDCSESGQLAIPDGSYTLLFSSWAIEPGVLQVKISNRTLKLTMGNKRGSFNKSLRSIPTMQPAPKP